MWEWAGSNCCAGGLRLHLAVRGYMVFKIIKGYTTGKCHGRPPRFLFPFPKKNFFFPVSLSLFFGSSTISRKKTKEPHTMEAGKTALGAFRSLFAQDKYMHSYEDAQNLLESLMLVSALLLAFSVGGLQNLNHDDVVEADARYLVASNCGVGCNPNAAELLSVRVLNAFLSSVVIQVATLAVAVALYVSLCFSSAREDEGHFALWMSYGKWVIAGDYGLLMAGIFRLFDTNMILVDMKLPMYKNNNPSAPWRSRPLAGFFNTTTNTMVQGGDLWLQMEGLAYKVLTETAVCSALGVIFLLHLVFLFKTKFACSRPNEDPSSLPEGSTAFKKWESVLDTAGMDFETCASIHDDFLLRKELEKAGVCIPGDRLKIILEFRKSQTQTTEIRADNKNGGGVIELPPHESA